MNELFERLRTKFDEFYINNSKNERILVGYNSEEYLINDFIRDVEDILRVKIGRSDYFNYEYKEGCFIGFVNFYESSYECSLKGQEFDKLFIHKHIDELHKNLMLSCLRG